MRDMRISHTRVHRVPFGTPSLYKVRQDILDTSAECSRLIPTPQ
jgi:hypothetical protein